MGALLRLAGGGCHAGPCRSLDRPPGSSDWPGILFTRSYGHGYDRGIYRLDWVSVLLANELGSDLMNVPIIMNLKGFLSDLEVKKD